MQRYCGKAHPKTLNFLKTVGKDELFNIHITIKVPYKIDAWTCKMSKSNEKKAAMNHKVVCAAAMKIHRLLQQKMLGSLNVVPYGWNTVDIFIRKKGLKLISQIHEVKSF